jgi:hypothetical protein
MPIPQLKPPIFISHSSQDKELVGRLVTALEHGLRLPPKTIFCSSLPTRGIPNGKRFIDYIRSTIDETKLVVFLVSGHFLKSSFCLTEFGAAWAKSVDQMILLTSSLTPRDLTGVFEGIQSGVLTDKFQLNELKEKIATALGPDSVHDETWEEARDAFLVFLKSNPEVPVRLPTDFRIAEMLAHLRWLLLIHVKQLLAVVITLVVGLTIYLGFLHPKDAIPFEKATKDHPWENSLGMKFVPVEGTNGLFCIWDTRVRDFETFVKSKGYDEGTAWKQPTFDQGPDYPVRR